MTGIRDHRKARDGNDHLSGDRHDLRALRAGGNRRAEQARRGFRLSVDLVPDGISSVTVTSDAPLPEQAISAALDNAGGYLIAIP